MNFQTPMEALSLLGLDGSATRDDIKSAYHRMAAYYHPDAGRLEEEQATDAFLKVRSAYDYLMDAYDRAYAAFLAGQEFGTEASGVQNLTENPGYWEKTYAAAPGPAIQKAPRIIGREVAFTAETGEAEPRTIGGDAAVFAHRVKESAGFYAASGNRRTTGRDMAEERKRQEKRALKRQRERLKKRDEMLEEARIEHSYDEAMLRIHALRAAEIVAKLAGLE